MIQDNTAKWKVRKFTNFEVAKSALPLGHLYFSLEKTVPVGSIPALGGLYSRALYADLFAYAQEKGLVISENEWQSIASNNGKCEYYSSGDGSTTFRLPKIPNTIVGDVPSDVPVVGNGMTLGVTDGTRNYGVTRSSNPYAFYPAKEYGGNVGASATIDTTTNVQYLLGLTTDSTKSGIVAKMSSTKTTGQWLIVAFGTASNIGNADVANVMQAVEQVQSGLTTTDNKIVGISDYIIESYRNGTEWYEVYKSGKVRQGGVITDKSNQYARTINFLKPYTNTKYVLSGSLYEDKYSWEQASVFQLRPNTTSKCYAYVTAYNGAQSTAEVTFSWVAEGQGA